MAGALLSDATAACVGSLTYLYFELGNELCEMLIYTKWINKWTKYSNMHIVVQCIYQI